MDRGVTYRSSPVQDDYWEVSLAGGLTLLTHARSDAVSAAKSNRESPLAAFGINGSSELVCEPLQLAR